MATFRARLPASHPVIAASSDYHHHKAQSVCTGKHWLLCRELGKITSSRAAAGTTMEKRSRHFIARERAQSQRQWLTWQRRTMHKPKEKEHAALMTQRRETHRESVARRRMVKEHFSQGGKGNGRKTSSTTRVTLTESKTIQLLLEQNRNRMGDNKQVDRIT